MSSYLVLFFALQSLEFTPSMIQSRGRFFFFFSSWPAGADFGHFAFSRATFVSPSAPLFRRGLCPATTHPRLPQHSPLSPPHPYSVLFFSSSSSSSSNLRPFAVWPPMLYSLNIICTYILDLDVVVDLLQAPGGVRHEAGPYQQGGRPRRRRRRRRSGGVFMLP